ncbi:MAG: glycogen synthase GlgA, partial [Geminicoccaceae bacterium]|nr:glycogen synthase GlgA [Geminicoccaceae bacterium]
GALPGWQPDLVHGHDWQAGLVPAYLALNGGRRPATVMTVHNLAYQGLFPRHLLGELGLPESSFQVEGVEFHGQIGFLKAGLFYADRLTTVSPTYAREIQDEEHGCGLHGLLRTRRGELAAILNGIDRAVWDPASDRHLVAAYEPGDLDGKAANKAALQRRLGLTVRPGAPVIGVVSRLAPEKGLDLLLEVLPDLLEAGGQLAMLIAGDAALEEAYLAAAGAAPAEIGVQLGYDESLAHLIQAGADLTAVPSRTEPCGLTQMYGMRYGALPLVARVGGLADSVIDASMAAVDDGVATGFVFAPVTADMLRRTLEHALDLYADTAAWRRIVARAMTRDFGWRRSAERYLALYRELAG